MIATGYRPRTVFFVGNSLYDKDGTNVFGRQYTPLKVHASLAAAGKNVGYNCYAVSGRTTTQLLADMPTKVIPYLRKNDVVVFTEGTNEVGTGNTVANTYSLILQCRDLVWAVGAKFVLQGCIACNGASGYANKTASLQSLNDYFRNTPSLVDGFSDPGALSQCDTDADCASATWFNSDGIHPLNVLYDLIAPLTHNATVSLL